MSSLTWSVGKSRSRISPLSWWGIGVIGLALLFALPVFTVMSFVIDPAGEVWRHLAQTVLADYLVNSFLLLLGVGAGTLLLGVPTAWLTSLCQFPGKRFFEWALLLPLAFPAYIIAYTYTGMLDFAGPVQSHLREIFAWSYGDYWFPEIRSMGGAILMLSLVLYPYVYLLARAAFLEQSTTLLEASRTLGASGWRSFYLISLPLARPAIITGLSLALMETLADYGTVQYFGISTFTTGIFRTWFGLGDSTAAGQLSALLLSFVFLLVLVERWSRRKSRYFGSAHSRKTHHPILLAGAKGWLAFVGCWIPLLFGFLLPALQLVIWSIDTAAQTVDGRFWGLVLHSLGLAAGASLLAVLFALFIGYGHRLRPSASMSVAVRTCSIGYAIPGTVIAVGVMLPLNWFDRQLDGWMLSHYEISTGLLLSGSLFMLVFAYLVRFLSVSIQTVEAGLGKIRPSMDDAARSLGCTPGRVLTKVHMPMLRGSLLTALLLVFVDIMKELPATLLLRPFNFNTLAVRTYELASDERLADASTSALAILLVGILPVILLSRSISRSGK